jgi:hypothetical protein
MRAFCDEPLGGGQPDTAVSAGNDGDLTLEPFHFVDPSMCRGISP